MVKKAHETGSAGDCAPAADEVYKPGDLVRYRVTDTPKGVAAFLQAIGAAPKVYVVQWVSRLEGMHGSRRVMYVLACGDREFWADPANLVRVDPPAPSGFVAVPPEPAPTPTVTAAKVEPELEERADGAAEYQAAQKAFRGAEAVGRPELSADQREMLVQIYSAGAVGLAYSLDCKGAKGFGVSRAGSVIAQLQLLGLARPVRETDDSQGGWCLTPAGEEFAEPLWKADYQKRKAAAAPQPPEAGDVLAEPGQIVWQAHGIGGLRSADGRFEVRHRGSLFDAVDTWTHETSGTFSVARSAQDWCWRRLATEPLEWRAVGTVGNVEVASVEPQGLAFSVAPCIGPNLGGQFLGIDQRFGFEHRNRHSPYFPSAELAKRWCEVRAACVATLPELALRYVSPVPF